MVSSSHVSPTSAKEKRKKESPQLSSQKPRHERIKPATTMLFLESQPLSTTRGMVLRLERSKTHHPCSTIRKVVECPHHERSATQSLIRATRRPFKDSMTLQQGDFSPKVYWCRYQPHSLVVGTSMGLFAHGCQASTDFSTPGSQTATIYRSCLSKQLRTSP